MDGDGTYRVDNLKLHKPVGKELQRPSIIAIRWLRAGKNNKLGFDIAGHLGHGTGTGPLIDGGIEPCSGIASSDVVYSLRMHHHGIGHLSVIPLLPSASVGKQQYTCSGYDSC